MRRLAASLVAVATATSALVVQLGPPMAEAARQQVSPEPLTCDSDLVEKTLANGASWRMCARIHPMKGLVLEQIEYRPPTTREYTGYKRVLDQLSLGQLNVPYDNGEVQFNDITSYGFGNEHLVAQSDATCLGDTRQVSQTYTYQGNLISRTVPGICVDEVATGLSTHSLEEVGDRQVRFAEQGSALEISSLSKIAWYEYQQNIKLDDQGQVDVGLGATGDVAPGGAGGTMFDVDPSFGWPLGGETAPGDRTTHAASHWHNAVWKVDFGVDGGTRQHVEQWDYANTATPPLQPRIAGTGVRKEQAFSAVPGTSADETTWFRVLNPDSVNPDGHVRSYEIVNRNQRFADVPVYAPSITFANAAACREYASDNLDAGCPGQSVLDYVAQDTEPLDDPVAWVNVGFHHIDRDEDQSPMQTHWQRFQLVPRDFFAQKPGTPDQRSCINGPGWIDSLDSPCVATNMVLPRITRAVSTPVVGTPLRATTGSWNEQRTTWSYQFLWLRDGEPITFAGPGGVTQAATGPDYVVSKQDLGTAISVRVTASQAGFPSGSAESTTLWVPGGQEPPAKVASTLTVSAAKARAGKRATVQVRVSAPGRSATGTVTIRRDQKVVGRGTVRAGKVSIRLKAFKKVGRHKLRAIYTGSATVSGSQKRFTLRVVRR
ncbi:Ig-like domain repeat protein [Nocardioides dubius]|uniref:Amine oxidase n=1 Tax=Nocardioides dubius TaxID=317019 RepID=A0ABP4EMY2_9ACTN